MPHGHEEIWTWCRNVAWISTKTYNFEQSFTRLPTQCLQCYWAKIRFASVKMRLLQWRQLHIRFSAKSFYYLWHWLCKQKLQWHHDGAESIFHSPIFPKFRRIWTFNLGRIPKKTFLYLFINFWPYKNQTQS